MSCEHASNRVPPGLAPPLGVPAAVLRSHVAWDPGARELASRLAETVGAPLLAGRYTRLLVDLNRSERNRAVVPRRSFGVAVPGNERLSRAQRAERLARYWRPYRAEVERAVVEAVAARGACLHLSVHTFVPELGGRIRHADAGLLYDPRRAREVAFARALAPLLRARGLAVRMNYPYRGTSDGFTTHLRRRFHESCYAGVEIELNQRVLTGAPNLRRVAFELAKAVAEALGSRSGLAP